MIIEKMANLLSRLRTTHRFFSVSLTPSTSIVQSDLGFGKDCNCPLFMLTRDMFSIGTIGLIYLFSRRGYTEGKHRWGGVCWFERTARRSRTLSVGIMRRKSATKPPSVRHFSVNAATASAARHYFTDSKGFGFGIDPDANEISRTGVRRYILVTVKINESRPDADEICSRLLHLFYCKAIIIGEKTLTGGARSIHIGIWNTDASKNTFRAYIQRAFPGEQPEITARKSWKPVYEYVSKVSNTFTTWGEVSTPTVMRKKGRRVEKNEIPKPVFEEKKAAATRRRVTSLEMFELLNQKKNWNEVVGDTILGPRLINNYQNMRNTYIDLQIKKRAEELEEHGRLPLLVRKILLLYYRTFYMDTTLARRITVILIMSFILGPLSFLVSSFSESKAGIHHQSLMETNP